MPAPRAASPYDCFAIAAPGLEPLVAAELHALGVGTARPIAGGVEFTADASLLARANIELRTATRVLIRLATFRATAFHELERAARRVDWARVLGPAAHFSLRVTCRKSRLYHSDAVAERVAEAIERAITGATRATVIEDESEPAAPAEEKGTGQLFVVRLDHDRCTISADASGELLHRRGFRLAVTKAPLRETLAAAMLLGVPYDRSRPLVDPMCGSGTIAIEAARLSRRIAPGSERTFACERWPEMPARVWREARERIADQALPRAVAPIIAADRDAGAIDAARANAARAGVADDIEFRCASISALEVPSGPGLLITNPPYGVRVGETKPLRDLFARLGQVALAKCPGWDLALLSANRTLESQVRLAFEERFETSNGGIPVRLVVARVTALDRRRPRRTAPSDRH